MFIEFISMATCLVMDMKNMVFKKHDTFGYVENLVDHVFFYVLYVFECVLSYTLTISM